MYTNDLKNPFVVSGQISEALFCDRETETEALVKQVQNGRNVVLVSPRRMGKTGLIHHLFHQSEIEEHYQTFFIDLYATTSLQELCYVFGRVVFEQLKSRRERNWDTLLQALKSLRGGFKIDMVTGEPSFELGIGAVENPTITLEEIFAYLESAERPCLVALDEFQQIAEYPDKRVEAVLRGAIQNCSRTAFIFSGSRQHTITQMFHSKARPFYQSAQLMSLGPIDRGTYASFACRLFDARGKSLVRDVADRVYDDCGGVTWYMQMIMNELFAITADGGTCRDDAVGIAWQNILALQDGAYRAQLATLSSKQKAVMQAIARERIVRSATAAAFVKKYSLDSASSVQSALRGLVDKDIVTHDGEGYRITDLFLAEWVRKEY